MEATTTTTTFYYSRTATVLPTITGLVSFASSVTIIATIIRSRIFSQYHRIILFMSFWDAVTSLAIACTTRPMPKDYDLVNGPTMGTVGTVRGMHLTHTVDTRYHIIIRYLHVQRGVACSTKIVDESE